MIKDQSGHTEAPSKQQALSVSMTFLSPAEYLIVTMAVTQSPAKPKASGGFVPQLLLLWFVR